jgi:hypothetical protein
MRSKCKWVLRLGKHLQQMLLKLKLICKKTIEMIMEQEIIVIILVPK